MRAIFIFKYFQQVMLRPDISAMHFAIFHFAICKEFPAFL